MEIESKAQLRKGLAFFLAFLGATVGYQLADSVLLGMSHEVLAALLSAELLMYAKPTLAILLIVGCAAAGYFLSSTVTKVFSFTMLIIDGTTSKFGWQELASVALGLIVGLVVANLLALPLWGVPFGKYPAVVINLILGMVGARVFQKRQRETSAKGGKGGFFRSSWEESAPEKACPRKILDTSVIIDGRILDVARTGFLDGVLVIPEFVLHELQGIADSSDPLRRMRGRRGLDVVNELQSLQSVVVEISPATVRELGEESVDSALLALGKRTQASVLTTDYNLLKVAQIHDVAVLNINDLANAIKPLLLPGDFIEIDVIREGKDTSQGVGYLEDGTMCVVEDGAPFIGHKIGIMVTSMLQTSAGRMIFGRTRKEALARQP